MGKRIMKNSLSLIMAMLLLAASFATAVFADESEESQKSDTVLLEEQIKEQISKVYTSANDKLADMELYFENDEYALYGLALTGEVGIVKKESGQILLTNPYDVASSPSSDDVKKQILSQIILTYSDSTGSTYPLNSFEDAAFASFGSNQIKMYPTRTGLRVEYTIGRESVKYLVPHQIEKEAFEENILSYYEEGSDGYRKLTAWYTLKDPNDPKNTQSAIDAMKSKWPITEKYAIYVIDETAKTVPREMLLLENFIKDTYYDDYSKVEEMYEMLGYVDTTAAPALFRFAIEYNLDKYGLEIKLPASSIRYDSSNYKLKSVKFLPYFCAGSNENTGFTLVPDGSGTITRFEDVANKSFTLTGKLYGKDYSFHTISGSYQETMRLPAFGVMETRAPESVLFVDEASAETNEIVDAETVDTAEDLAETDENSAADTAAEEVLEDAAETENTFTAGYVAYLVEGDAMAEITADHGGPVHKYSSVYTTFYPKPGDEYVLESISASGSATWTVESDRIYNGNYTLRIFPISGDSRDYNEMAAEIRNYLTESGNLEKMTAGEEKSDDVPLYLETFGTIKTPEKIAGFPVNVQSPLTTFAQTQEMLTELKESGVNNINLRMTGWYNGGMKHTPTAKIKVESKIGGEAGLKELTEFAKENNVQIYPNLEFVYVDTAGFMDGFDFKDDTVKTIDSRSATRRNYNALYQGFDNKGSLILSPTSMMKFYGNIKDKFASFGTTGISVGTLGSELSSDHNSDYTLHREDSKSIISNLLGEMKENHGEVMIDGGNAYALPYADHVLGVALESSLNINTSESIPFVGMVLHGNLEFTGNAINLEGDYDYSVLKAMENGASLYFLLSKENTSKLKQFEEFSKYYAISYDIWKEDLVATYNEFNEAMKKVKYSYLTEHETVDTRIVKVTYENGVSFVLNYNNHPVEYDGTTIEALSFAEIQD